MGAFFVYILKTAVCLALFYLFYQLLLSRETFHRFNPKPALTVTLSSDKKEAIGQLMPDYIDKSSRFD